VKFGAGLSVFLPIGGLGQGKSEKILAMIITMCIGWSYATSHAVFTHEPQLKLIYRTKRKQFAVGKVSNPSESKVSVFICQMGLLII